MTTQFSAQDNALRELAIAQLRKKHDLQAHMVAYAMVNLLLVAIWLASGAGFFWPVFPLVGWGIGLVFHAWDVYSPAVPTEDRIEREMQRLAHRHGNI